MSYYNVTLAGRASRRATAFNVTFCEDGEAMFAGADDGDAPLAAKASRAEGSSPRERCTPDRPVNASELFAGDGMGGVASPRDDRGTCLRESGLSRGSLRISC